jgi:hypothetical protein
MRPTDRRAMQPDGYLVSNEMGLVVRLGAGEKGAARKFLTPEHGQC